MGAENKLVSQKMFGNHGLSNPAHDPKLKTTGGMLYYQYDGMNTVSSVTNRHGEIIENYRYDVFGGIQTGITAPYNNNAYTNQRYDDKVGLIDMNARWYDPTVGRFLTQDTYRGHSMDPQTLNRYAYVLNNPVNMWDPTGNVAEWIVKKQSHEVISNLTSTGYTSEKWSFQTYNYHYTSATRYLGESADSSKRNYIQYFERDMSESWKYIYTKIDVKDGVIYVDNPGTPVNFGRDVTLSWTETVSAGARAKENASIITKNHPVPKNATVTVNSTWKKGPNEAILSSKLNAKGITSSQKFQVAAINKHSKPSASNKLKTVGSVWI